MDLSAKTLREVEFREKLRGYHPTDVDEFLEQVAVAVDDVLARLAAAEAAAAASSASSAGAVRQTDGSSTSSGGPTRRLPQRSPGGVGAGGGAEGGAGSEASGERSTRTLELVQRAAGLALSEAHESAQQIIAAAHDEASRILAQARVAAAVAIDQAKTASASSADVKSRLLALAEDLAQLRGTVPHPPADPPDHPFSLPSDDPHRTIEHPVQTRPPGALEAASPDAAGAAPTS